MAFVLSELDIVLLVTIIQAFQDRLPPTKYFAERIDNDRCQWRTLSLWLGNSSLRIIARAHVRGCPGPKVDAGWSIKNYD
ncbi:hypothetical protein V8F06_011804 [Rhypophila decipiens]